MRPRDRVLASLVLLLALILSLSCNPNPQPEGLTPIPTLAPAATLTLVPSLEGGEEPATGGEATEPSPVAQAGDPENGATIFGANCAVCHGDNAAGGSVGPTLISTEMKAQEDDFYRQVISNGRPGTAMPAWSDRFSAQDIEDVIAFLRSLQ